MFNRKQYLSLIRQRRNRERRASLSSVAYIRNLLDRNCTIDDNDKLVRAVKTPQAFAIMHNNGNHTFLAHSTTPQAAAKIAQDGLHVSGRFLHPELPDVQATVMLLAGPQVVDRLAINEFGIIYRYMGSQRDQATVNSAKVILELPIPYPGTIFEADPFASTPLAQADGTVLICDNTNDTGNYRIPAQYVKGYFDLLTGEFYANPHFAIQ
jgi:hypothetical protein